MRLILADRHTIQYGINVALSRCAGFWTVLLAIVHLAMTPLFYPESVRSIVDGGVLWVLDADPALTTVRAASFWYVTCGLFLGLVGAMVLRAERWGTGTPAGYAVAAAGTGLWGVLITPQSGFWLFFVIAWLAWRNTRQRSGPTDLAMTGPRDPSRR